VKYNSKIGGTQTISAIFSQKNNNLHNVLELLPVRMILLSFIGILYSLPYAHPVAKPKALWLK
jgi:hypothetical protein